ncbi:deoxyribodipyrimidine photo-lyase [Achromobacter spanius]|uniref:Deoxyribodipyrimidine photo-lyase n=1 Tax=Achromobacter spanius TaxID=217203 RepID=A0AAW3I9I5_9BURK|nr:deoxyribodipyrimidine photo-lyase [Achromobacter spanius]AZS79317.1 deoxyribodipyrimidine photo-lyase [Achromobacter spanius]KNE28013.1 deoxyribodipyrimidine photolyase [Achromobacter spanius]MCW3153811.1 deoxyribodipyrimidine photo-lyase [Achromobacter spanius]
MNTLLWLRTDLRMHDNPALAAAAENGTVTALFLAAPEQWRLHGDAPAKVDFWLRNLHELSRSLGERGIPLKLLTVADWSQAPAAIAAFCQAHGISQVHANTEWAINERRRDAAVANALEAIGVDWTLHHGATLLRPGTVQTGKGDCYRVYTPYARTCRERLRSAPIAALPAPRAQTPPDWQADPLPDAFEGYAPPSDAVRALWPAGEAAATDRLDAFADGVIDAYKDERDFPSLPATSCLSPYLAAGVLSAGQALRAALVANQGELDSGRAGAATWINELLWREFYLHLLAAYPSLSMHQPMKPETAAVPWRDAPDDLRAWQQGKTGIPIVDAAMRQLLTLGWMHNRLRMVTAMFLSKNLLIDWRLGEAWFMEHLVDGDLAANNGGWQWSASTGADAVPYFRVFNPLSQSKRFDPRGVFLREWLPELAHLDDQAIHDPSPMERAAAAYPLPIVDLAQSRLRALEAFGNLPAA